MNWFEKHINPLTYERLRRFTEIKRGWYSFILLAIAYALSLGAEFICGNQPLYVRYENSSYFPTLKFYPEDTFTGNGRGTRPDYKAIRMSDTFKSDAKNFMIFPLIPFGPEEIIDPATIAVENEVEVAISKELRTGTVNLDSGLVVKRSNAAEGFFGNAADPIGLKLSDYFEIGPDLRQAMALRFQNQSAPRFEQIMKEKDGREISLTMPSYEPREVAPTSVRITLRDAGPAIVPQMITFDSKLHLVRGYSEAYAKASSQEKEAVKALVAARLENPVESKTMQLGGKPYTISFAKADIRWPFRPVEGHIMGIDSAGRDVLARIIYGFRISMSFGLLLTVFSMALGIAIGAVQGYYGGFIDISCQRAIEIWSSLPFLYVMILMGSIYGQSFLLLLIIYGIFNWIGISYYMRGEFFKLRNFQFVEAAKCLGVPTINILFKHIFPNALVPVITFFPFSLVGAIGSLAALDYLGFGMPQPTASWGELLNQAQQFRYAWWLIVYPSLALFIVMLLGVFIGEGVRNAFDPRSYVTKI